MSQATDFETLLVSARLGEDWAWTRIYRELSPRLLHYLRVRGANRAEELLGEVFVDAVRQLPRFEGDESAFRAHLYSIARNRLTEELRGRHADLGPIRLDHIATNGWTAADGQLRRSMRTLSAQQRDVVLLRVFGQLTAGEVSLVMPKNARAVRSVPRALGASGAVVFDEAVSRVRDLPPASTAHLEATQLASVLETARFLAECGAQDSGCEPKVESRPAAERWRRLGVLDRVLPRQAKIVLGTSVMLALSAVAVGGQLPAPLQDGVAAAVAAFGIDLPDSAERRPGGPAEGRTSSFADGEHDDSDDFRLAAGYLAREHRTDDEVPAAPPQGSTGSQAPGADGSNGGGADGGKVGSARPTRSAAAPPASEPSGAVAAPPAPPAAADDGADHADGDEADGSDDSDDPDARDDERDKNDDRDKDDERDGEDADDRERD